MKKAIRNLFSAAMLIAASIQVHAQGLLYDQQSATGPVAVQGNGNADGLDIQEDSPLLQSFIPSLSAIGFVQFEFVDFPGNGNNGATVYVNLWTGSTLTNTATFLGSTTPVFMPNGFVNSGLGIAGITNFFFSTPITLTAGQTYYLQPVVLSGDDPWDIITIGDTYPNGRLFGKTGGFFQPSTDFWFREGVSVPEPSVLALIVVSSLLVFVFKRRSKLVILLLFTIPVLSVHASQDSIVQATADEAGLAPVSAATLPDSGTFWVMTIGPSGDLIESPDPFLPASLSALPIYSVTGNIYMVDDTGGQISPSSAGRMSSAQATATAQTQAESMADLIDLIQTSTNESNQSFQSDFSPMLDTNGLWLEASNKNNYLGLRLHNTVSGDNYQLLSTSNLENGWNLGEIKNAPDIYTDFSPVPITNSTAFFKAHHANPVMLIQNGYNSTEPNPTNDDPGQVGTIYIENNGWATNDVPVYYSIGGTAQNGIDYSNLTGAAVVPLDSYYAEIDIDPIADGLKPDQTVILTLLQNTNYLIDPANDSATNILTARPQVYPTANGDKQFPCPNAQFNYTLQAQDPNNLPLTYTILTYPTHGSFGTNGSLPYITYTPTNCYEGQDSFTFTASDGQYTSTPATVTLTISDTVYANAPYPPQTCRGGSVGFQLSGGDSCSETLSYALLSQPLYGSVTNVSGSPTDPNYVYTSSGTNFTGTNAFNYVVYNDCGDVATNTVTITVGDANVYPNPQSVMTGTNQRVAITLSAADYGDACTADTNYYAYTITSPPTNGYLTGIPPNLTYTPTNGEGMDSFQFNVNDGNWTSSYPATVTIYVVAGPALFTECDPFGTAVQLDWSLDTNMLQMMQQDGLGISDFIISRSTNSGGLYAPIFTNYDTSLMNYQDDNVIVGQTNYYVVTFEFYDYSTGITYESPNSNEIEASGQNPDDLLPPNAFWNVVTNLSDPTNMVRLQAPFSNTTNQYPNLYPLPNSIWPPNTSWTNRIALYIPSNVVPSQVQYSIAIDNYYWLYVNNTYIGMGSNNYLAAWSPFQPFPANTLHAGTNDIVVGIQDVGDIDYFSMVVTTNTCGQ